MAGPASLPSSGESTAEWVVRPAVEADADAVADGVRRLLVELGAEASPLEPLAQAARAIIADPDAGLVFVAEEKQQIVGVLAASLQQAIHVPGRYAIIQDLWVESGRRGRLIGAGLVEALVGAASDSGAKVVEVGLPKPRFRGLEATEAFYLDNGFSAVGSRMRRVLA